MADPRRLMLRGVPFVCTHKREGRLCGRVIYTNDPKVLHWLIGPRVGNPAQVVVRCPQHITEMTLRSAGRRRTKRMYKWARLVKELDDPMDNQLPPGFVVEVDPVVLVNAYLMSKRGGNRRGTTKINGVVGKAPWPTAEPYTPTRHRKSERMMMRKRRRAKREAMQANENET